MTFDIRFNDSLDLLTVVIVNVGYCIGCVDWGLLQLWLQPACAGLYSSVKINQRL